MSCSVNPSIKTRVSAASEPPYHEEWTLKLPHADRVSLPHRNEAKPLLAVPADISTDAHPSLGALTEGREAASTKAVTTASTPRLPPLGVIHQPGRLLGAGDRIRREPCSDPATSILGVIRI